MITTYCQNQIVVSITKLIMIIKSVYQGIRIVMVTITITLRAMVSSCMEICISVHKSISHNECLPTLSMFIGSILSIQLLKSVLNKCYGEMIFCFVLVMVLHWKSLKYAKASNQDKWC